MRLPRERFTVRRLMVAVAIMAVFLVAYRSVRRPWIRTVTYSLPMPNGKPGFYKNVVDLRVRGAEADWVRLIKELESKKIPHKIQ